MADLNPQTSDDDKDNPFKGFITALQAAFKGSGSQDENQNPLAVFFQALISFFKMLMGGASDPNNSLSYDEGPAPGTQGTETRRQYDERQRTEAKTSPKFNDSVRQNFTPSDIVHTPGDLLSLRQQAEAANGGHKVQAIMPVRADGVITSPFGEREAPMAGASTTHKGVDIAPVNGGNPDIIAPMPGKVVGAGWMEGYGNTVDVLDIYGTRHRFGHLKSIDVKVGQIVEQGQKLAVMGMTGHATGVHVHYEQRDKDNVAMNPTILGQKWAKDQTFTETRNLAFLESQSRSSPVVLADAHATGGQTSGQATSIDKLLAQMDLSFSQSGGYAAPNTSGSKAAGSQPGRSAGG
jgi:murein DD-endopeptidase MepM/ murein hydrolase activator NlpD